MLCLNSKYLVAINSLSMALPATQNHETRQKNALQAQCFQQASAIVCSGKDPNIVRVCYPLCERVNRE